VTSKPRSSYNTNSKQQNAMDIYEHISVFTDISYQIYGNKYSLTRYMDISYQIYGNKYSFQCHVQIKGSKTNYFQVELNYEKVGFISSAIKKCEFSNSHSYSLI
jgi:hypothetical protein